MKKTFDFYNVIKYLRNKELQNTIQNENLKFDKTSFSEELSNIYNNLKIIKWENFENLSRTELQLVPINYILDWISITKNFDKKDKVYSLYSRFHFEPLSDEKCLKKFDDDIALIEKIRDDIDYRYIFKRFLVKDKEFINLVYEKIYKPKERSSFLPSKTESELLKDFNFDFNNGSRGYLLQMLILEYAFEKLKQYQWYMIDRFWEIE